MPTPITSPAVRSLGIALVLFVAACGNVALNTDAGADGPAGPGGATGTAGSTGGGGATGGGGGHAGAPGGCACAEIYQPVCGGDGKTYGNACEAGCAGVTVAHTGACADAAPLKLELQLPANKSFCDDESGRCGPPLPHITILANGQPLVLQQPTCATSCSGRCEPVACPTNCLLTPSGPVTGPTLTWDGSTYPLSKCGQGTECYSGLVKAPAGKYVARMCATPGTLTMANAAGATCTPTGPTACVDVPFDYPSTATVVGHLP
jgi:hypothetical protein